MKIVKGWAMPDFDEQFERLIADDGTYQLSNLQKAVAYCRQKRTVIDGGAHVGTWSKVFAREFGRVMSFEPSPDTFVCLGENLSGVSNVELHHAAIGRKAGMARMTLEGFEGTKRETNSGSRYVTAGNEVEVVTIDSFGLTDLDLLKMDIEGSEVDALAGAAETLKRCRPVVIFEAKREWLRYGYHRDEPHRFLTSLGARKFCDAGIDEVWGWR